LDKKAVQGFELMPNIILDDPGLVENGPDGASCVHACFQMLMRLRSIDGVLSFREMDNIMKRKEGMYSWEYALLAHLCKQGYKVKIIQQFDMHRFVEDGSEYIIEYYGEDVGNMYIEKSDVMQAIEDAKNMLSYKQIEIITRIANIRDIQTFITDGFYVLPSINQRILQADAGYVPHLIFIYGISERGIRFHNPGPPATSASEIPWELFHKAWSSPVEEGMMCMAVQP
jgi:hypothetical protein